jgi:DNA-directed RNA polymerase alpha subunit
MAYDDTRKKVWEAVNTLVGSGTIQERLAWAAECLIQLRPDEELPKKLREEFEAVCHELTKETATGNEGNIAATTRKLSSEEGTRLARHILSLYTKLHGGI